MTTIKRVAVIGCGTVGASWAALFLGHGLDVAAYDPSPGAEDRLQSFVDHALDQLAELGTREKGELRFSGDLTDVLGAADFVQENVPEDEALKRRMLAETIYVAGDAEPPLSDAESKGYGVPQPEERIALDANGSDGGASRRVARWALPHGISR